MVNILICNVVLMLFFYLIAFCRTSFITVMNMLLGYLPWQMPIILIPLRINKSSSLFNLKLLIILLNIAPLFLSLPIPLHTYSFFLIIFHLNDSLFLININNNFHFILIIFWIPIYTIPFVWYLFLFTIRISLVLFLSWLDFELCYRSWCFYSWHWWTFLLRFCLGFFCWRMLRFVLLVAILAVGCITAVLVLKSFSVTAWRIIPVSRCAPIFCISCYLYIFLN